MAVGLDLDTEYLERTGIPSGGAGTLSAGGFADFFAGVWLYRPSATATYALTNNAAIINCESAVRTLRLGFNGAGAVLADLSLYAVYNSGGGTGTPYTFPAHAGNSFLDEWVYYFVYENASNNLVAGYILKSDLNTAVTNSYANDNATSQYINTLTFGNVFTRDTVVLGHYAYARARDSAASAANVLTYANSAATIAGDWGFWPLANNTDTGDTSGNSRPLTFGGTVSSETSPTFESITWQPTSQQAKVGGTATFSITAVSATSYQWQDNSSGSFANISGATSASYTTATITSGFNNRAYRCVVNGGTLTSNSAQLHILLPGSLGQFDPELRITGWF